MSISIKIPHSDSLYQISETRTERLLSGDKKQATYMGLWDKFKDYFRSEKKAEVMERLYDFIHSTDDSAIHEGPKDYTSFSKEITSFLLLKSLATEQHKSDFLVVSNPDKGIDFHIGSEKIKTLNNGQTFFQCCKPIAVMT